MSETGPLNIPIVLLLVVMRLEIYCQNCCVNGVSVCVSCETMHNSDSRVGAPAPKSVRQYRIQTAHMLWLGLHL